MPLDLGIVGLVGSAIKLSWAIYEKGFTKEKSLPQRYIEFGDALFRIHSNLTTIESIVKTANTSLENDRLNAFGPQTYDTTSLTEIVGNFRLTLEECHQFLNDDTKFRQKDRFITNIIYNINVDPQVIHLTERLAFHSTKIGLVVDPFNIHVQTQLRNLHKEQHQDVAELLQELKYLLISGREPATEATSLLIRRDLDVPIELSERFELELQQRLPVNSSTSDGAFKELVPGQISVKEGLDAFFLHFNGISHDGDIMSYLRLMKSIWVMDKIRECDDWSRIERVNPGGLYDRCVREMDRRLRAECSRAAKNPVERSRLSVILQLPEKTFAIWPTAPPFKKFAQVTHLGVLLDVPVLPNLKSHTLRVVRNIDGTLGIEDSTTTITESSATTSSDTFVQKLNIEPRKAYFVPVYSIPGSDAPSCTVKLQSSRDGINGVAPEFKSTSDLLKLQHLITGYRCVKQRKGITVTSLIKSQDYPDISTKGRARSYKKPSVLIEAGNLQLWHKAPYGKKEPTRDDTQDPMRSGSSSSSPDQYSSSKTLSAPSIISAMSSAHTQQISIGSSRIGIEITQPEPRLLVLFLKQPDTGQLSFLVIELDERTKVEPNSCDCRSSKKACATSVLERSGTPLLARRFYARNGLNSWNLAAIGEHWSSNESESIRVQNMYWLRLAFNDEPERIKFNNNVADLIRIFASRMDDYLKDLKLVRGTHIISQTA